MTEHDAILAAGLAQKRVATPRASAWVSANAGSGKTRVLTERVARLLLDGAEPSRILCLTYTRAAAAEMANRLSSLLGGWVLLPEPELRARLAELDAEDNAATLSAVDLAAARRLFARALETPGGLKIQTIHAFCGMALRRFPLEAGVSPDFQELDAAAQADLLQRAIETVAAAAEAGQDDAFDGVASELGEEALTGLVDRILAQRALFRSPPDKAAICAAFRVGASSLADDPLGHFWEDFDRQKASEAVAALRQGGRNDGWIGEPLASALQTADPRALRGAFLDGKGNRRSFASPPTKAVANAHPWLRPWLSEVAEAWAAAAEQAEAIFAARRTIALNRFGCAVLEAYEQEKHRRAALDFDDLIGRTLGLLKDPDAGAWALWKLDGGIDHLLVDEAQDTSPDQWRLIRALTGELVAGDSARRTLFVVGDEKQSIYSFQGAEPALFGENAAWFDERLATGPRPLIRGELATSFRSSPAILRTVDATFALGAAGLSGSGSVPVHVSAFPGRAGRVDLWPIVEPTPADEAPAWYLPVDALPPGDPSTILAETVAEEVGRLCEAAVPLPGAGRAVSPGDVLILLRRRGRLAPALVRALKRRGLPVAGADRLRLAEELAVRDLLALARVALTPGDDLGLAALLRSPLCGLSEDALFSLAHGRQKPLWRVVMAAPNHAEAAAFLRRMRDRADFLRPYEFLDAALTLEGGRHRLLARLGLEAEEAIDELLAQALAYEASHTPSLEGFLAWLTQAGIDIKREQDRGGGTIRVMTVHGAKGLEAPLVILPDTLGMRSRPDPILTLNDGICAWRGGEAAALKDAQAAASARAIEENRRLLYVAMTRAEHWLIVAGAGKPPKTAETWHGLVGAGMMSLGAVAAPGPAALGGDILRLESGDPAPMRVTEAHAQMPVVSQPTWLDERAPMNRPPPPRLAASGLGGDAQVGDGKTDAALARLRGVAIHALLEELPTIPPAQRTAYAEHRLRQIAPEHVAAHDAWFAETAAILTLPAAEPFFADSALPEVALSWAAPDGTRIAGRIDRLCVGEEITAIDFKTDALPPMTPEAVPLAYLRQMAVYDAALRAFYPERPVAVSLLWTTTRTLMPLPSALLSDVRDRLLDPPSLAP